MSNAILLQQSWQLGQILVFETRAALAHSAKHIIRIIIRRQQESSIVSPPSSPSREGPDHREIHRILHLRLVVPLVFYPVPATGTGLVERVRTKGFDHQPLTAIRNSPFNVGVKLVRLLHDYLIRETQSLPDTHKVSKNPPTLRNQLEWKEVACGRVYCNCFALHDRLLDAQPFPHKLLDVRKLGCDIL